MEPDRPDSAGAPRAAARPLGVLGLLLLALVAAACSRPSAPGRHSVHGAYIVHGVFSPRSFGARCDPADAGYPDIHAGTPVTIRDGTGTLLGSAALAGGTLRKGALRGRDDDCVFSYSLTVPERDAYRIEVGRRGVVRFQRSELERTGWQADLTIGAYTMFGGI